MINIVFILRLFGNPLYVFRHKGWNGFGSGCSRGAFRNNYGQGSFLSRLRRKDNTRNLRAMLSPFGPIFCAALRARTVFTQADCKYSWHSKDSLRGSDSINSFMLGCHLCDMVTHFWKHDFPPRSRILYIVVPFCVRLRNKST